MAQGKKIQLKPCVFLDRDGVLVEETEVLDINRPLHLYPWVPQALQRLKTAGFALIVITNQPIVARGLATEAQIEKQHEKLNDEIQSKGGPAITHFYFCPHHPRATLEEYRVDCQCRKPRAGSFYQAQKDHGIDLMNSFFLGDRISDIVSGAKAGVITILIKSGAHLAPPITTSDPIDLNLKADFECDSLEQAVPWILNHV